MPKPKSPAQGYTQLEQIDDDDELKDPARSKPGCPHESKVWPEYGSGLLARLFFTWFAPMERLGAATPLEHTDLWSLHEKESTRYSYEKFKTLWDKEVARCSGTGADPSLSRVILNSCLGTVLSGAALRCTVTLSQFARPLVMQQILKVAEGDETAWFSESNAWVLAIAMFLAACGEFFSYAHYMHVVNKAGWRVREALIGMLFRKVTWLSPGTKATYSSGKITNMMSSDCDRLRFVVTQLNLLWIIPLQFVGALILVINLLGPAGFMGLVLLMFLAPTQRYIMRQLQNNRRLGLKQTDERLKLVQEVMSGIRIIKFMSWEESFVERIGDVRERELALFRRAAIVMSLFQTLMQATPIVVCVMTLGLYALLGNTITASTAFPALSLLMLLREPLQRYPRVLITVMVDGQTAVERIGKFLNEDGIEQYVAKERAPRDVSIQITNGSFKWASPSADPAWDESNRYKANPGIFAGFKACCQLCCKNKQADSKANELLATQQERTHVFSNLNLEVKAGSLTMVVGKVGTGKTSLLHAMLGELIKTRGDVRVNGTISYASQSAFILNCSLRDNITFGAEYDEDWYNQVVYACALEDDLDILPAGDTTQIGERGINLSGGQKQRVSLARAIYQDCDIYLLDDPLSAVDPHVGKHIFDECIISLLKARNKTVILPTHSLIFLQYADQIVTLGDETIKENGTYEELINSGGAFAELMRTHASVTSAEKDSGDSPKDEKTEKKKATDDMANEQTKSPKAASGTPKGGKGKSGVLMKVEERERGKVNTDVYMYYAAQCGKSLVVLVLGCFVVGQLLQVLNTYIMSRWAMADTSIVLGYSADTWSDGELLGYFLFAYGGSGLLVVGFTALKIFISQLVGLSAARRLHRAMLDRLVRTPVAFFDVTPVGRIVNRFASDFDNIDRALADNCIGVFGSVFALISSFSVIIYMLPVFAIWLFPLLTAYYRVQYSYRLAAREMKRLNSNARSPIFQHFNETLQGLITIRAFGATERFSDKNMVNVDYHMRAEMGQNVSSRWLTIRLQFMGAFSLFVTSLGICLFPRTMDAGLTGMVINYALQATGTMESFIQNFTELELKMNAMERIKHYTNIKTEKPYDKEHARQQAKEEGGAQLQLLEPPPSWPDKGRVEFTNICARYRPELDRVLDGVSFVVESRQKVGVVGRTGSGKSSLMLTLFRVLELERGSITIDGVDIARCGLKQLRQSIAMLPQDPTIFSGSIKQNLDPFGEHSDSALWDALDRAQLKESIEALPKMLDTDVGEGGDSFSVGQRQLLCLARAVLRDSKLLVMDECTASVDVETDALVQKMIREVFSQCTVFAIAHRLGTIIDYDSILVLSHGTVVEAGSPADLLDNPGGALSSMVEGTGAASAAHLRSLAYAAAGRHTHAYSGD